MSRESETRQPLTMATRLYIIIFAGFILAQGLSLALLFAERHESSVKLMLNTVEHDVATSVMILDSVPAEKRPAWLERLARDNYHYLLGKGDTGTALVSERSRTVTQLLARELGPEFKIYGETVATDPERYQVHFTLHDGAALTLDVTPRLMPVAHWLPVVLGLQLLVLLACTWFAVRQATRPLTRLAQAAEGMTPSADNPKLSEEGPREVMSAAIAFNAMQDRIARHLKERLHILAAISHDLQTPITRMRLRADTLDDDEVRERLVDDLREMEHLVREGVAYARSVHGGAETPVRVDIGAFLESLVFDYQDMGRAVSMEKTVAGTAMIRQQALRRVLGNLIDNALKYAGDAKVGACWDEQGRLCITVADRGPGIPEHELDKVLQPFYRLEASRNRDTGGSGLGLAIAAQLVRAINGKLVLSNRDGGGLAATITLG